MMGAYLQQYPRKNRRSIGLMLGIVLFHFLLLRILLIPSAHPLTHDSAIHYVFLSPDKTIQVTEKPEISAYQSHQLVSPIEFPLPDVNISNEDQNIQGSIHTDKSSGSFSTVFHPELRKRLQAMTNSALPAPGRDKVWVAADGRTYQDMGDGRCMVTMGSSDSHERGANWGFTTCDTGNSESDKIARGLNAAMAERRGRHE